jgi:DNA-binding Lrp family transcriptional regulator
MVTAVILVQAARDKVRDVAQQFLSLEGITEVYSVAGRWDLVAIARVSEAQDLADLVTGKVSQIGGIVRTETLMAFQAFSRFDLERLFSIGLG